MTATALKHGDFSNLANMYSSYRPGYSETVLDAIIGITGKPANNIEYADVGAGTGIWTRMVASRGCKSVTAVEPNAEMRQMGSTNPNNNGIQWREGSGENTGLTASSVDLLSMASSFHWVDFEKGTQEFHRVLRKGGHFVALWNPRYIDDNPMLVDIENKITELCPTIKRVSSGRSDFVNTLSSRLLKSPYFYDLTYLEGRHTVSMTQEQYIGVWNSVNDVRFQLGEEKFAQFMAYIQQKISSYATIDCTYLTRAWIVKK